MRKLIAMSDPEFAAGSVHIAHVPVTNPTPQQWTYNAELYLWKGGTKYNVSEKIFTLAANSSDTEDFSITMPSAEGTYQVYLDIYVAGNIIGAYQALEDVIVATPGPAFTYSNEQGGHVVKAGNPNYSFLTYDCDITNPTGATATEIISLWRSDWEGTVMSLAGQHDCCTDQGYGICPSCKDPGQIELTLAPGQSYHYHFCCFNGSTMQAYQDYLWLEDDRGGESAHKSC